MNVLFDGTDVLIDGTNVLFGGMDILFGGADVLCGDADIFIVGAGIQIVGTNVLFGDAPINYLDGLAKIRLLFINFTRHLPYLSSRHQAVRLPTESISKEV